MTKSLHQLPLKKCTFPPLLFLHWALLSWLRRISGMTLYVERERANPGSPGRMTVKPGFHYPSWRPELMARVDGWPVSITRQHGNSGSGNRALDQRVWLCSFRYRVQKQHVKINKWNLPSAAGSGSLKVELSIRRPNKNSSSSTLSLYIHPSFRSSLSTHHSLTYSPNLLSCDMEITCKIENYVLNKVQ